MGNLIIISVLLGALFSLFSPPSKSEPEDVPNESEKTTEDTYISLKTLIEEDPDLATQVVQRLLETKQSKEP